MTAREGLGPLLSLADALPAEDDEEPPRLSAASVCGPTMPSTVSPWAAWNWRTAARVTGP